MKNKFCPLHGRFWMLPLWFTSFLIVSCAPVNRFTRLKKTPREYAINSETSGMKVKKKLFDHTPWIVFSGKSGNASSNHPGGRTKCKELSFLEPFYVIKKKGDYLGIVKYSPDLAEGLKLKDRKKASYYGWVHKSEMLLHQEAVIDIFTGLKDKYVVTLTDTTVIHHSSDYLSVDSALVYADPYLTDKRGVVPLYSIVYLLKKSDYGKSALISLVPQIYADSIAGHVPGWISTKLLQKKESQLHCKLCSAPEQIPSLKYNPVFLTDQQEDSIVLKTYTPVPVVDRNANFVLNVKGRKITYPQYRQMQTDMKRINIIFALEGQNDVLDEFPTMVNVIQNLIQTIQERPDGFQYRIGISTSFYDKNDISNELFTVQPSGNFVSVMDSLSAVALQIKDYKVREDEYWEPFRRGVEMTEKYRDESNLVVLVGVTGYGGELPSAQLVEKIARNNCRIVAFQLYGGNRFTYDHFVLQMKNLIVKSAAVMNERKKELLVSPSHLREMNYFKQSQKNIYNLDFPDRSMSQGWLLFPEKNKKSSSARLTFAIDTLIAQVKQDNKLLLADLERAFAKMGNTKNIFTPASADYLHVERDDLPRNLMEHFRQSVPLLLIPQELKYAAGSIPDYYLLLNKEELNKLRSFIDGLASHEVDYIKMNSSYLPTSRTRRHLRKYFIRNASETGVCGKKRKILKKMKLADILYMITRCPSNAPFLSKYVLKDLNKKRVITDERLDSILQYIQEKKEILDQSFQKESFTSGKQVYYWIGGGSLP